MLSQVESKTVVITGLRMFWCFKISPDQCQYEMEGTSISKVW